ncbi:MULTISPECIES: APC family permease [unclassified Saccharibacter]|uniref:APC family permease n=1 Tax=unclassified Saccharibacter TaxID=2648722 RepID=UPI001353373F|nr:MULTISPECIES: amino acid permease [unclassified Saccharibacter]MXV57189.1 amino acid permease [Saccharibacter sp. EH70]MXV66451.1 amino acid permease [Saccharibacter sp. EH60]
MSMPIWRTKSIDHLTGQQSGLKRVFGPWRLIAMGVGVTVGAGLFSLTGVVAGQNAGPAVTLSFLIAAIAASFAGLCYAELAGMIPAGGSAYAYAYTGLGEGAAWIIGWDLILEYTVGAAAVASSWSGYLASLLKGWGLAIDPRLLAIPGTPVTMPDGSTAHAWFNAPSIFIICAITALLMRGTSESVRFNTLVVIFKVLVITGMIVACIPFIHLANYHPFIPPNTGEYGHFGFSGVMRAAGMAFFAYIGIDIVSTAAQDTKDPQRNMPIGILGSLAACAFIYIVFSTMLIGIVDYHRLANDGSPVATAIDQVHMPWLAVLVKIGVTLGYISGLFGLLIGQSRIMHNMSYDGLIPSAFSRLNKRTQTPWTAHILTAIASSVLAATMPIGALGAMTAIGTLLAFIIVCAGVTALRLRSPHTPRRFRVPGGPFLIPALGIISCGIVMGSIDAATWERLVVWLILGVFIYVIYGMRHSHLHKTPPHDPS